MISKKNSQWTDSSFNQLQTSFSTGLLVNMLNTWNFPTVKLSVFSGTGFWLISLTSFGIVTISWMTRLMFWEYSNGGDPSSLQVMMIVISVLSTGIADTTYKRMVFFELFSHDFSCKAIVSIPKAQ